MTDTIPIQTRHYGPSAVTFLSRDNGLPSGQVHTLVQAEDGVFCFATPSGLARYDGSRVSVLSRADGLSSHGLRALAFSSTGSLWVGSDVGLDLVNPDGTVAAGGPGGEWNFGLVDSILFGQSGVWIGTPSGLYLRSRGHWHQESDPLVHNRPIRAICENHRGHLYASVGGAGLLRRDDKGWQQITELESHHLGDVLTLSEGLRGSVLVGGANGFAVINDAGRPIGDRASDQEPVTAALFHHDLLWLGIGGQLRVYHLRNGRWEQRQVVTDNVVINQLSADDVGSVWAATESHGVLRVNVLAETIRPHPAIVQHPVFAIRHASDGQLLIGGDQQSHRLAAGFSGPAQAIPALDQQQVWDLLEDASQRIWAATANGLLRIEAGQGATQLGNDHPTLAAPNRCLLQRGNEIWVGTLNGCVAIDADDSIRAIADAGQSLGYVYTLVQDATGDVWIGTLGNGLWRESNGGVVRLSGEGLTDTGNTYAVALRNDGAAAISQDDRIVLIAPEGTSRVLLTTDDAVAAWSLCWAADGQLWAGSASGLSQYNGQDGRRLRQLVAMLGLANWEFTTSRSLYIGRDGRSYCGLNSGLVEVDTAALDRFHSPPQLRLHRVRWQNATPESDDNGFVLPPGNWSFTVEVFAAWYLDEQDLAFRYRLVGFDDRWSPLAPNAEIHYSSLPPGQYRLEAQAYNRLVGFGPLATLLSLTVLEPSWIESKLAAPARGLAHLMSRYRNRDLHQREVELEQIINERTSALELANAKLAEANRRLSNMSFTDALTGVSNRRYFDELLIDELERAARAGQAVSLLLLDIDFFKGYNDLLGHGAGDECLRRVAHCLADALPRNTDSLCRYGGEEFVVVLPSTGTAGARAVAENLRKAVLGMAIEHHARSAPHFITISVGGATWLPEHGAGAGPELLAAADMAMYTAKENGRNRVEFGTG